MWHRSALRILGNDASAGFVEVNAPNERVAPLQRGNGQKYEPPVKPLYERIPLTAAIASWFDQMWYAESIFVRCGENSSAPTAAKLSGSARGATQGSFWSLGAGSDNAEISERTRYQRAKIALLPLRFRDKEAEEEFVFNSSRLWVWRNICLFVFKVVATTCVYAITTSIGSFSSKSYVPDAFLNGVHTVYVALLFLAVASLLLPIIPVVKQRLEYATYALLITEALVLATFLVYEKVNTYSALPNSFNRHLWTQPSEHSTGDTLCVKSPKLTLFIVSMELIMDSWIQFFMYFFMITMMKRQVKVLESERDKATDSNLRSGVSALQSHCKQVEVALMGAKTAPRGTNIYSQVEEAAFHINACLEIMPNTKDLYYTELNEELQENVDSEELSICVRVPRFVDEIAARVGSDLSFDLLNTGDPCHSAFFECGYALLRRHTEDWGCDDCALRLFLIEIEGLYNDNPYHNSTHGAMEVMEMRSNIITLILATDMKTHFSALSRLRACRQNASFDHRKQRDDTWLVAEMCMRAADIGHGIVAWEHHFEWSCRITSEFYLQGDEETRLKRGVSPLCDRDLHSSMARSQVGFLAHIVKPLFAELNSADCMNGAFQGSLDAIEANINEWQRLHDSGIEVVFPPTVASCEEALRVRS
ncbi:hypothetical protein ACSSS7_003721 [Eimeria intestinalis]